MIASMSRAARAGKVFIDWSQNDRDKTTACVFSVRARPEPTVSWPLRWDDLQRAGPVLASERLDLDRAARLTDVLGTVQRLPDGSA